MKYLKNKVVAQVVSFDVCKIITGNLPKAREVKSKNTMRIIKNKFITSFTCLAMLLIFILKANAQHAEFGLRFMPTFSTFDLKTSDGGTIKGEATMNFGAGALLGVNFNQNVGIQAQVIYSTMSQKYKQSDVSQKVTLNYINVPILLSLNTGKSQLLNFNFVAGPQVGISAGSSLVTTNNTSNSSAILSVKKGDLGFAYGGGLDVGLNQKRTFRAGVGFLGCYGLFSISDKSNTLATDQYYILDKAKIKTYSAYAGFSFLFM
jgi:hypothetical protein